MLNLSGWMISLLTEFAPVIYGITTSYKVEVLVVGAILATGKRTVSVVLRVMGMQKVSNYASYHHILNRAVWSGIEASQVLLRLLLKTWDGSAGNRLKPKAFIVTRYALAAAMLSKRVAYAG